jgi:hypothetical protein
MEIGKANDPDVLELSFEEYLPTLAKLRVQGIRVAMIEFFHRGSVQGYRLRLVGAHREQNFPPVNKMDTNKL